MAGFENSAGLGVNNFYGPRSVGKTAGVLETDGAINEVEIVVDSAMIGGTGVQVVKLPKGVKIISAYAKVTEAFALGGTTPTILVGTSTSEVTNGFVISKAQAEAVGTYDVSSTITGTWASQLSTSATTTVGYALGGTSPTKTSAGKVKVLIRYIRIA